MSKWLCCYRGRCRDSLSPQAGGYADDLRFLRSRFPEKNSRIEQRVSGNAFGETLSNLAFMACAIG